MRPFRIAALTQDMIDATWPIVRFRAGGVTPARWREFAAGRIAERGALALLAAGLPMGVLTCTTLDELEAGRVLLVDLFALAGLTRRGAAEGAMLKAAATIARRRGCGMLRVQGPAALCDGLAARGFASGTGAIQMPLPRRRLAA